MLVGHAHAAAARASEARLCCQHRRAAHLLLSASAIALASVAAVRRFCAWYSLCVCVCVCVACVMSDGRHCRCQRACRAGHGAPRSCTAAPCTISIAQPHDSPLARTPVGDGVGLQRLVQLCLAGRVFNEDANVVCHSLVQLVANHVDQHARCHPHALLPGCLLLLLGGLGLFDGGVRVGLVGLLGRVLWVWVGWSAGSRTGGGSVSVCQCRLSGGQPAPPCICQVCRSVCQAPTPQSPGC